MASSKTPSARQAVKALKNAGSVGRGRPPSAAKKRSLKVADEIAEGVREFLEKPKEPLPPNATPLDVLIMAMRKAYLIGGSLMAAEYAEKAAPYLHGKISSIELKNTPKGTTTDGAAGMSSPFRVQLVPPPKQEED